MLSKPLFGVLALAATMGHVGLLHAEDPLLNVPVVSEVSMQQIQYTRKVEITYKLSGAPAIITLAIEVDDEAIPDSAVTRLEGDVSVVVEPGPDTKSITWNAGADWPDNITDLAAARVTAWPLDCPPSVMVVDLRKGTAASAGDQYPVKYYPSTDALLNGIENTIYKNEYLVLKKIHNGSFTMGEGVGAKDVTLTSDFYIGVYQLTQGQWANIAGTGLSAYFTEVSSCALRPMEQVSYYDIRESTDNKANPMYSWPDKGSAVNPDSFMGKLRACTGNRILFDLPTDAQWEYACRAGTATYYSDGLGTPSNTDSNEQMNVLGRYNHNGGQVSSDGGTTWVDAPAGSDANSGTAIVGSYLPNPWGLYDVHGNVYEWCLDRYASSLPGGIDPEGPGSGSLRVHRGGGWFIAASASRSASRNNYAPSGRHYGIGLRVAAAPVVSF